MHNSTDENVLLPIGTSYTFNKDTGKYDITNVSRVDLTTLNYDGDTKYYYCNSWFDLDSNDAVRLWTNITNCASILELNNVNVEDGEKTGPNGSVIKTRIYI